MRQALYNIFLKGRGHNPHSTGKETEAQRNQVICPRAQVSRCRSGIQNQNEVNEAFSPLSVRKHGCGKCH